MGDHSAGSLCRTTGVPDLIPGQSGLPDRAGKQILPCVGFDTRVVPAQSRGCMAITDKLACLSLALGDLRDRLTCRFFQKYAPRACRTKRTLHQHDSPLHTALFTLLCTLRSKKTLFLRVLICSGCLFRSGRSDE